MEKEGLILSISEHGFGKRTPLEDYRLTNRGGKGVINMKTTNKTGNVVGDSLREGRFRPDDRQQERQDDPHRIRRHPSGGPFHAGRATGSLEEGDQVAAASVIPEAEDNGEPTLPLEPVQ